LTQVPDIPRAINPAFVFAIPALMLISVFFLAPIAAGLILSFTDFDLYTLSDIRLLRWIGLSNYDKLLHDPRFWVALKNTAWFALVGAPISVAASLFAALLVTRRSLPFPGFWRSALFLPVVTTLVAAAVVWRYLYHPRYGLLNYVLGAFGIGPIDWIGDPAWAMTAILMMAVWKNFGFNMIIFVAGIQNIPPRLYEAAALDGANGIQQLAWITVPMLAPTFAFVGAMTMIGHFQLFAEPYVMTGGGPSDSTLSLALLMYQEGFRWWNLGYAAAVAFCLFALILSGSGLVMWLGRSRRTV
jgi:multiple sugar transport system permease protein